MMVEPNHKERLLKRITALVDELITIDLNLDDEPGALASAAMGAPATLELLDRADRLLRKVAAEFGDLDTAETEVAPPTLETMLPSDQEVCDLAFVCRSEIRPCRQRLEAVIAGDNPVKVVAVAGEAIRRLCGALHPLEVAIAKAAGLEAPTRVWWDLEISLEVRKIYADLRGQLNLVADPEPDRVHQGLIDFTLCFESLKDRDIYRFLRFDDRIQLGNLLRRTKVWLRQGDDGDPITGMALWKELANLVELMRQVSNRAELREFDRRVLNRACRELYEAEPRPTTIPEHVLGDLGDLVGLDSELDWLLANGSDHPPKFWEHCLRRLAGHQPS